MYKGEGIISQAKLKDVEGKSNLDPIQIYNLLLVKGVRFCLRAYLFSPDTLPPPSQITPTP